MKLSIIVPVYNSEKYLEACLESLVNQTYKDIEVILVNDGSVDNSEYICRKYATKYNFVSLINQSNSGVSSARNIGILSAHSELIMFVDSDDYISLDLCEKLICNYNYEDLVFCEYQKFRNDSEFLEGEYFGKIVGEIKSVSDLGGDNFLPMYNNLFFNTPVCKIYKRSKITTLFEHNLNLGEDILFNLNYLMNCSSIKEVKEKLYFYRIGNSSSLSNRFDTKRLNDIEYVFKESIRLFSSIFNRNFKRDSVILKYLEEYSLSIKKMLSSKTISYKDKRSYLDEYRHKFPLKEEYVTFIHKLRLQYRLFLSLFIYKMDFTLILMTKVFNLSKSIFIKQ